MPARLRSVPDAPPRALGLIRVSTERDDMVAPELQRAAIEDHCARRGFDLVGWVEGIDDSGSQRRSRWWGKLDQAVEQVETGDVDILVVWRFSRAARQRLRWAVAIDRVEVAGGLLESATEPLDTSTASGRLARGMLAEFAAYEAETIGGVWREVHARRTAKGLPANGKPRFGYRVMDGIHRPDPDEAPVLAALYRRYVAGESIYSLVSWLNAQGLRTVPGYSKTGPGPWTQTALRRVLDSGFGAGFITVKGERARGIHEPVIDAEAWQAFLAARAARRTRRRAERSQYLLSGLVRCCTILESGEPCGAPMGGGQFGHRHTPKYRCVAAAGERRHPGGYVTMRVVEAEVLRWLRELAADVEVGADASLAQAARATRRRHDARKLAREAVEVDKALTRLAVNQASDATAMPEPIYSAARDELLAKRTQLEEAARAARVEAAAGRPAKIAADLLADWETVSVEHRRGTLRQLIARIEVVPARPISAVQIIPAWGDQRH